MYMVYIYIHSKYTVPMTKGSTLMAVSSSLGTSVTEASKACISILSGHPGQPRSPCPKLHRVIDW